MVILKNVFALGNKTLKYSRVMEHHINNVLSSGSGEKIYICIVFSIFVKFCDYVKIFKNFNK